MPSTEPESFLDLGARLLTADAGAVERTLDRHRRGEDGRCTGCGPSHRWPCAPASIALHAVAVSERPDRVRRRPTLSTVNADAHL